MAWSSRAVSELGWSSISEGDADAYRRVRVSVRVRVRARVRVRVSVSVRVWVNCLECVFIGLRPYMSSLV